MSKIRGSHELPSLNSCISSSFLPPETSVITDQLSFQYLKSHGTLICTPGPQLDCLAVLTRNPKLFLEQKQGSLGAIISFQILLPTPYSSGPTLRSPSGNLRSGGHQACSGFLLFLSVALFAAGRGHTARVQGPIMTLFLRGNC